MDVSRRVTEFEFLNKDIRSRLSALASLVDFIRQHYNCFFANRKCTSATWRGKSRNTFKYMHGIVDQFYRLLISTENFLGITKF